MLRGEDVQGLTEYQSGILAASETVTAVLVLGVSLIVFLLAVLVVRDF